MAEDKTKETVEEIIKIAQSSASAMLKKTVEGIVSVNKDSKSWKVIVETLERKSIPDTHDLLGRYEFELNEKGSVLGYKQIMLRRRSELRLSE